MKTKTLKGRWIKFKDNLRPPIVVVLCFFCFLAGFFISSLSSLRMYMMIKLQFQRSCWKKSTERCRLGRLEMTRSLTSMPFQVLSWYPRALYFPNFASADECETIIDLAKAELKPSMLALRKGETEETTMGIRTSSGMFISASQDKSGTLDVIEEKIARATMLPRTHGELNFLFFFSFIELVIVIG